MILHTQINMADEIMVEHLKRPGSPTREAQRSKRRRSRSLTPPVSPSSSTPPLPNQKKIVTQDSVHIALKENNIVNHKNAVSNESLNTQKAVNSMKDSRTAVSTDSMKTADSNVTSLERHKNDSVNSTDKDRPLVAEQLKADKVLVSNRKRSPSPTLSSPQPKRNNRDIARTENITKLTNDKSPPLLAPVRQTGLSSASQVLNEEFKRKQTTQNLKLKQNICKEIRKNSKS